MGLKLNPKKTTKKQLENFFDEKYEEIKIKQQEILDFVQQINKEKNVIRIEKKEMSSKERVLLNWSKNLLSKRKIEVKNVFDKLEISSIVLHLLELLETKFNGFIDGHILHPTLFHHFEENILLIYRFLPSHLLQLFKNCLFYYIILFLFLFLLIIYFNLLIKIIIRNFILFRN